MICTLCSISVIYTISCHDMFYNGDPCAATCLQRARCRVSLDAVFRVLETLNVQQGAVHSICS